MSENYDYALALIENDVRNDCEYYVYSQLRDVVDGLENDNEVLTKLLRDALEKKYSKEDELQAENAKLRELARMNWLITLSERDALRIHSVDPDDGAYITALDETINEARATMQELGIEVE